ncbi:MAG: helix-turn-helix domain-containing protein, partial [Planctomycetota bacterium]
DLENDVRAGRVRADLYYRLNVIPVFISPLRDRKEDIMLLAENFAAKFSQKTNVPVKEFSAQAKQLLVAYTWPGNVRELENTIERAILLNRSNRLEAADFPERLSKGAGSELVRETEPATPTLESIEKAYIHYVMSQADGKKSEAARILGIDASTLYRKLDRYQLDVQAPGKAGMKKETKQI